MVKSYKGVQQVKPAKIDPQSATVSDYMSTKLITFKKGQTMGEVIRVLLSKKISGGPVVDEQGNLVGMISEGDCLKEVVKGKYNNSMNLSGMVEEYMATNVKTISPETNIFDAAQMFLNLKLRRFPVIREGKLIGQISQKDIMAAFQHLKETTWGK